jgi:hypothetical protein
VKAVLRQFHLAGDHDYAIMDNNRSESWVFRSQTHYTPPLVCLDCFEIQSSNNEGADHTTYVDHNYGLRCLCAAFCSTVAVVVVVVLVSTVTHVAQV